MPTPSETKLAGYGDEDRQALEILAGREYCYAVGEWRDPELHVCNKTLCQLYKVQDDLQRLLANLHTIQRRYGSSE